jgi:sec-independent protein translocase protein TatC
MRLPRRLGHGEEATLVEHLGELRGRIVVSLVSLVGCSIVAFAFHHRLLHLLNRPLPHGTKPTTFAVAEPFLISIKLALVVGFLAASPIILWQVWAYLAPALEQGTQRAIASFVALATGLLAAGLAFGYFVALPAAVHFLLGYDRHYFHVQVRAEAYFSFATQMLVAIALVFELPIVVLGLVRLRVLSSAKLRRNRRIGYFIMVVIGACLPGPDLVTTVIQTAPLLVLFELSIWLSVLLERRWRMRAVVQATETGA